MNKRTPRTWREGFKIWLAGAQETRNVGAIQTPFTPGEIAAFEVAYRDAWNDGMNEQDARQADERAERKRREERGDPDGS